MEKNCLSLEDMGDSILPNSCMWDNFRKDVAKESIFWGKKCIKLSIRGFQNSELKQTPYQKCC